VQIPCSLKNKLFGHHPYTMGYVSANFRISTIFLEKNLLVLPLWPVFGGFLQMYPQLKAFF